MPGEHRLVPCESAHGTETVASRLDSIASGGLLSSADPQIGQSCRAAAATALGVADPSFGGRLRVVADPGPGLADSPGYQLGDGGVVTAEDGTPLRGEPDCQLVVVGKKWLTASLVGWGNRPLPLTG